MTASNKVRVTRLTVYPVKSLEGIDVACAKVLPSGALEFDRRWAMIDAQGQLVNGKRTPRIHDLTVNIHADCDLITIGWRGTSHVRTFSLKKQPAALSDWLSDFFEFEVSLKENSEVGYPDDLQAPGPTILSAETLLEVANWFDWPLAQTRRRFRANIELATPLPFWEDRLFGERDTPVRFRIGDVLFDGSNPCARCVVPGRDPDTGVAWPRFTAEFTKRREQTLPTWAERSRFDHFFRLSVNTRIASCGGNISVGDAVELLKDRWAEVPSAVFA